MSIKFSPGPCGCCGYQYAVYVKCIDNGGASGEGTFAINVGVAGYSIFWGPSVGYYAAIVSNADLVGDVILPVFTPTTEGLPLTGTFSGGPTDGSSGLPPPPSLSFPLPSTVSLAASAPAGITQAYEYGLYMLTGSKGAWKIVGHAIKTVTGSYAATTATFSVAADGTVT